MKVSRQINTAKLQPLEQFAQSNVRSYYMWKKKTSLVVLILKFCKNLAEMASGLCIVSSIQIISRNVKEKQDILKLKFTIRDRLGNTIYPSSQLHTYDNLLSQSILYIKILQTMLSDATHIYLSLKFVHVETMNSLMCVLCVCLFRTRKRK
jgi:hypothetical protein